MTNTKTTQKLEIHGFPPSTYVQTALMVAAEAGVEVALVPLEFKQPSHFKRHPFGKMPALSHGDVELFETLAIASYIDTTLGHSKLQPADPVAHARMLQWVSAAIDYTYEDLVNGLHADSPTAEVLTAAGEQLKLIDQALEKNGFLAGKEVTLADLFVYPMVEFAAKKLEGGGKATGGLEGLPALARWRKALAKRPAVKKAAA